MFVNPKLWTFSTQKIEKLSNNYKKNYDKIVGFEFFYYLLIEICDRNFLLEEICDWWLKVVIGRNLQLEEICDRNLWLEEICDRNLW